MLFQLLSNPVLYSLTVPSAVQAPWNLLMCSKLFQLRNKPGTLLTRLAHECSVVHISSVLNGHWISMLYLDPFGLGKNWVVVPSFHHDVHIVTSTALLDVLSM